MPQLVVLDLKTGLVTSNVLGAGVVDEVTFNAVATTPPCRAAFSSPMNVLFPARPPVGAATSTPVNVSQGAATLDVIEALSENLDQRVPTLNVPADPAGSHSAGTAYPVAAYAEAVMSSPSGRATLSRIA